MSNHYLQEPRCISSNKYFDYSRQSSDTPQGCPILLRHMPDCFSHQKYREIFESISNTELNDISANTAHDATEDEDQRALIAALSVEEFKANVEPRYVDSVFARVLEINAGRTIADLKSQLQRLDPATQNQEHDRMFQQLLSIEEFRRALREQSLGTS